MNGDRGEKTLQMKVIQLGRQFNMLVGLSLSAGMVVPHEQLFQRVWGPGNSGDAGLAGTVY